MLGKLRSRAAYKASCVKRNIQYSKWVDSNSLDPQKIESGHLIKISILCPVYNTPVKFLKMCLDSVLDQSHSNWELCIVDDASESQHVRDIVEAYAKRDQRIRFFIRNQNGHISQASNDALKLATGDYVGFLDHDDVLRPNALAETAKLLHQDARIEFIYSDEDKLSKRGRPVDPFFKPAWSPHYLRSRNYISHFTVIKKTLVEEVGGFRTGYEGAQDWDLFLRVTRHLKENQIAHIPHVLYSWRQSAASTASRKPLSKTKPYAYENQRKALEDDLKERGYHGRLVLTSHGSWIIRYEIKNNPLVSIIIPTKDQYLRVSKCLKSILKKTAYRNYEFVIVDTGSTDSKVFQLYEEIRNHHARTKVLTWNKAFNFSAVCNFAAGESQGEYLLLLNNDTEVLTPEWLESLLEHAQLPEAGAVGGMLFYPNGRIQHAGIILGVRGKNQKKGIAGHAYRGSWDKIGMRGMLEGVRNYSAITGACLMVRKKKYFEAGGMDEGLKIAFNDVDFCLKLRQKGYFNIYTSLACLIHHESVSVGKPGSYGRNQMEFEKEQEIMHHRWGELLQKDPFYHPHLTLDRTDFSLPV
jgi:glycosyltransferase involved in cell wall biosynthesis